VTRRLSYLLTVLLFAQAVLFPAHCLLRAAAPAALTLTICTADGLRSVTLHEEGEAPAASPHGEPCLVCHALPAVAEPTPPGLFAPAWASAVADWPPGTAAGQRPPIRGPPSGARAPPTAI